MKIEINTQLQTKEELYHLAQMLLSLAQKKEGEYRAQQYPQFSQQMTTQPQFQNPTHQSAPQQNVQFPNIPQSIPQPTQQMQPLQTYTTQQSAPPQNAQPASDSPSIFDIFKPEDRPNAQPKQEDHPMTFDVNRIIGNVQPDRRNNDGVVPY